MHEVVIAGSGRPYLEGDSIDHRAPLVLTVPDVFSPDECAQMIARIDGLGPTVAPITTDAGFELKPDVRNNERVMFDDLALASELYTRIEAALPAVVSGARKHGINERFRCYRYRPGQRFAPHHDGSFRRDAHERSELTLMIYLNAGFDGGHTRFLDWDRDVAPVRGGALVFQHRLIHEGCVVHSGVKYVLRSDVMYRS